ncbi:MAG: hypothetical protein ACYTG5_00935 [Planctomycetota bacterium]|jgi:hypothetical protein
MRQYLAASLAALSLASLSTAQESTGNTKGLVEACAKMQKLAGVEFASIEIQTNSITRQVGGQDVEIDGNWSAGVLQADLNLGEDQVLMSGGRMLAKKEDGSWKLRRNSLVNGEALPFVFDPKLFFDLLARIPADSMVIKHREQATYRGQEVEIMSIELEGEEALDFAFGGALPKISAGMSGMMMMRLGGGSAPAPEITIDLALYVDRETNLVHRVKAKAYKENPFGGNVQFRVAGGGAAGSDPEAAEEIEEFGADGKPIYVKGLRQRKAGENMSIMEFDVRLSSHGKSFPLELGEADQAMLKGK